MKKAYCEPEIALFRLSAVVMTASGDTDPDPSEWETEIMGTADYADQSDDA